MSKGTVVILRGPSGSGKSTLTKRLVENAKGMGFEDSDIVVCSADNFFMEDGMITVPVENGVPFQKPGKVYNFNPAKLGEAHAQCLSEFIGAITEGKKFIIVDNTNIKMWEWRNYGMIAMAHGYAIDIHEFRVDTVAQIKTVARRNVHRVPADIVYRMCVEFEPSGNAIVHQVFPDEQKNQK